MRHFEHQFDQLEDYLHHRAPYLMLDRIETIEKTRIVTQKDFSGEEFFSKGHFPGAPILPGAMMQEMTTQTAGVLIAAKYNPMELFNTHDPFFNEYALGVLVRIKDAKYRGFARPGDRLTIEVNLEEQVGYVFDFIGKVFCGDKQIMRNHFQLANIPSKTLQGVELTE